MPRLVRRSTTSWRSIVIEWLIRIAEHVNLVDWDSLSKRWVLPAGLFLNTIYWLACAQGTRPLGSVNNAVFEDHFHPSPHRHPSYLRTWWTQGMWSMSILMLAGSLFNMWYCFSRTKLYHLEGASLAAPIDHSSQERSTWVRLGHFLPFLHKGQGSSPRRTTNHAQAIAAWDPPLPSLRLFAIFSPLHALLSFIPSRSLSTIIILTFMTLQTIYLIEVYTAHLSDRKKIYGQVFNEYEKTFVAPRLNVMKRDVGVGTRPDDNGVYVEVHTPKVGIVDAKTVKSGVLPSVSQIKMHDWEHSVFGPNTHQNHASPMRSNAFSSRHTIASPHKIDGSPVKMFRPAGWGSSGNLFDGAAPRVSKATRSLSEWD